MACVPRHQTHHNNKTNTPNATATPQSSQSAPAPGAAQATSAIGLPAAMHHPAARRSSATTSACLQTLALWDNHGMEIVARRISCSTSMMTTGALRIPPLRLRHRNGGQGDHGRRPPATVRRSPAVRHVASIMAICIPVRNTGWCSRKGQAKHNKSPEGNTTKTHQTIADHHTGQTPVYSCPMSQY